MTWRVNNDNLLTIPGGVMSRKSSEDLAVFKLWLIEKYDVSSRSATVYASRVRSVLKKLEVLNVEELDKALSIHFSKSTVNQHVCAWKKFALFCADRGILLPMPSTTGSNRIIKPESRIPELVVLAVINVMDASHMKLSLLPQLRWNHVTMCGNRSWEIRDPHNQSLIYMAPPNDMRIICDWANGEDDIEPERPFLPKAPMSFLPLSKNAISRATSGRRNTRSR